MCISLFGVRLVAARRWFDYVSSLLYGNLGVCWFVYYLKIVEISARSMLILIHLISAQIIIMGRALTFRMKQFFAYVLAFGRTTILARV